MTRCLHLLPQPTGPAASPALRRPPVLRDSKNRPQNPKDPQALRGLPLSAPRAAGPAPAERSGVSPQPARPEGTVTRAGAERARREPPATPGRGSGRAQGHKQGPGAPSPGEAPQPALTAAHTPLPAAPSAPTVTPRAPRPHLTPPRAAIGPFRRPSADLRCPLVACHVWAGTPACSSSVTRRRAP